jgi:lipopolysaccharide export LptBFGC system permease protein LptF
MKRSDKTWALWLTVPFFTFLVVWFITGNPYGALGGFTGSLLISTFQAVRLQRQSKVSENGSPREPV